VVGRAAARLRARLALTATLVAAACGGEPGMAGFARTDSAGVSIAMNTGVEPAVWRLSPQPRVVIGEEARGDTPLFRVYEVRLGSDGRVVVGHGGGNEVRTYAADGRLLWAVGRAGDGPGEFRHVTGVTMLPGDTVAVLDLRLRRLTLLDPGGALVSVTALTYPQRADLPPNAIVIPSPNPLGTTSRHEVFALLHGTLLLEGAPGVRSFRFELSVFDANGQAGDSLLSVPVVQDWESPGGEGGIEDIPFAPLLRPFVAGDLLYLAPGDAWQVDVYDVSGRHLRSVREARGRVPVTPAMIAALPALPPGVVERSEHVPDSLPAVGDIVADALGRIWAVAYRPDDADPTSARAYGADGRLSGVLALPGGFQLMDVRGERVVGVQKDTMGVETVVVYGLEGTGT
jgi:hypothetical protein